MDSFALAAMAWTWKTSHGVVSATRAAVKRGRLHLCFIGIAFSVSLPLNIVMLFTPHSFAERSRKGQGPGEALHGKQWRPSVSVHMTVPVIVPFPFTQRYFIRGVTLTWPKGQAALGAGGSAFLSASLMDDGPSPYDISDVLRVQEVFEVVERVLP